MATEAIIDCDTPEDDPVTKAEIAEAITSLSAYTARMPVHWLDRKADAHRRLNDLLDQWENTPA